MLLELSVSDLGVIADLSLVFGAGMTAITGETGAGKTLVVEAVELLVGGRADPVLVRPEAEEARIEGRFESRDEELVLARVIPAAGRSRGYVNGRLVTVGELAEVGRRLIDLHGQHAHQSLLSPGVQRQALDRFGGIDLEPLLGIRRRLAAIEEALEALGGDERARGREADLLRFQIDEIAAAAIEDPSEDVHLEAEEAVLADATAHREAAAAAAVALSGDGGSIDGLGDALRPLQGRVPFAALEARLRALHAELGDAATELRRTSDAIVDDPERLEAVVARRRLLADLRRKYGDQLTDVVSYAASAADRLAELNGHQERVAELSADRGRLLADEDRAAATVHAGRRDAAPRLAAEIERHLQGLAMAGARFAVTVGDDPPGDAVSFLLGANRGEPMLPVARVASGGELARTMLAARLVLTEAPDTLVFDEVDAGVGGEAALAVGRALAALGRAQQVLVVTHLPQVAAFADHQVAVTKTEDAGRTVARAALLRSHERVVELSRMLSGQPASEAARGHAEALLASASQERNR